MSFERLISTTTNSGRGLNMFYTVQILNIFYIAPASSFFPTNLNNSPRSQQWLAFQRSAALWSTV